MKTTLIASILFSLVLLSCNSENETVNPNDSVNVTHVLPELPDSVYGQLKPGDIVIRKGNGPLSWHLMRNTKEEYSHCGVIVKEDGKWRVIHTIGGTSSKDDIDGVQMIDLEEFVAHAADSTLYICRPVFDDSLEQKIPERAYHYLAQEIPFDHRFSMFTTDKYYCTELLFYIFKDIHEKNIFDIEKKNRSYMLMFSTFFHEELFQPIFHLRDDNL